MSSSRSALLPGGALLAALALLVPLGAQAQEADPNKPLLRIYDIAFLTQEQMDFPGRQLAGTREPGAPREVIEEVGESFLSGEDIVESIRTNFHEDSWADNAHSIEYQPGRLVVVNTPPVHEVIARYLAALRAQRSLQVTVEATLVDLPPAALDTIEAAGSDAGGILLTEAQRKALTAALESGAEGRILQVARATGFSGQRIHVRNTRVRTFVYDYDVEIAENSMVADPVRGEIEEGSLLDVRPMVEFGGSRITLEIRYEQQALAAALAAHDAHIAGVGRLHLPVTGRAAVRSTLTVPPDTLSLAAVMSVAPVSGARRCLALLVRCTLVRPLAEPEKPVESEEKRQFRMFDVGFLTRGATDFPGPSIDPTPFDPGIAGGVVFLGEEVDAGLVLSTAELGDLIQKNVAPESWSNTRNRIWMSERQIMAVQTVPVLDAIQAYLQALAKDRGRMVRVDLLVIGLDGKYRGEGIAQTPFAQGATLAPAAFATLRQEALQGGDLRVLAEGSTAGFQRQRVHATATMTRSHVSDLDVEVATSASGHDPVIGQLVDGLVFDVRPSLVGDGAGILLDLRPALARLQREPETFDTAVGDGNRVHLVDVDLLQPRLNLTVREGEWTVAALASDAGTRTHKAVLVRARSTRVP